MVIITYEETVLVNLPEGNDNIGISILKSFAGMVNKSAFDSPMGKKKKIIAINVYSVFVMLYLWLFWCRHDTFARLPLAKIRTISRLSLSDAPLKPIKKVRLGMRIRSLFIARMP